MRDRARTSALVLGLGVAQLLAWGTLYYAVAVLAEPMRRDLGVSQSELFGAFAWSMLISGILAPAVGRWLDRAGGRTILAASTLVGALGFSMLAAAHSRTMLVVAWSINGVAMALGLYETCFAALGQVAPRHYRGAVTGVTLIAGFASTVAWPASHYLVVALGWRITCAVFAGVLLLCLPVYLLVLPGGRYLLARAPVEPAVPVVASLALRRQARWLALAFAGASLVAAAISAHLVATLDALGFTSEHAVWVASSVGALQVLGRLLELASGARQNAIQLGFVTFAGLAASMLCLLGSTALPPLVYAFVVVYGISNGLATIARAALPVELFGLDKLGALLGGFSAPSLVTRAIAPLAYAAIVDDIGYRPALVGLTAVGIATLASYAWTTRTVRRRLSRCDAS